MLDLYNRCHKVTNLCECITFSELQIDAPLGNYLYNVTKFIRQQLLQINKTHHGGIGRHMGFKTPRDILDLMSVRVWLVGDCKNSCLGTRCTNEALPFLGGLGQLVANTNLLRCTSPSGNNFQFVKRTANTNRSPKGQVASPPRFVTHVVQIEDL